MDRTTLTVVRAAAMARAAIGFGLALRTRPLLQVMLPDEKPSGHFVLFSRTVGIRDALFGLGCLLSTLDARGPDDTRRWVRLWLANEVADVVTAVGMSRQLGVAGAATAAGFPLSLIAVDVWTLRRLTDNVRSDRKPTSASRSRPLAHSWSAEQCRLRAGWGWLRGRRSVLPRHRSSSSQSGRSVALTEGRQLSLDAG